MSSLARIFGLTSYTEPRGVRADFCDHCLTICPHWAFDTEAALESKARAKAKAKNSEDTNRPGSFLLCQICSAKSPLPAGAILMSRQTAQGVQIEELIDRTNPELCAAESQERIQQQLYELGSEVGRRQMALSAFAYAQEDLATDLFRLADIRIWGSLALLIPISFKLVRRAAQAVVWIVLAAIPLALIYRVVFVPRLVQMNLKPAWIRLLTGTNISFGELASFIEVNRSRFGRTYWLLRSRPIRSLGDDGLLHRDPAALTPGIDFLPPPTAKRGN